jgi:L-alanine-DL-glutamate epimerase-like enolase superfamily enzyme
VDATTLAAAVAALDLEIESGRCLVAAVALPDYPGGPRPTAEVALAGRGREGRGEHVAFTDGEQRAFAERVRSLAPARATTVGAWADGLARSAVPPYARAALEAAAIDLAFRQAGTNLFRLAGVPPAPVRWVVSQDARTNPLPTALLAAQTAPGVALKLDVATGWGERLWRSLAQAAPIAVLDWKGGGTEADFVRAHAALPDALHEDPRVDAFPSALASRLACDASVQRAADVAALRPRPAAVNVKPARVGGVLEALAVVAACAANGIAVYFGGMWEVGVGRGQLHVLAGLLAPDGPNDVAPLVRRDARPPRPLRLDRNTPGFGER